MPYGYPYYYNPPGYNPPGYGYYCPGCGAFHPYYPVFGCPFCGHAGAFLGGFLLGGLLF